MKIEPQPARSPKWSLSNKNFIENQWASCTESQRARSALSASVLLPLLFRKSGRWRQTGFSVTQAIFHSSGWHDNHAWQVSVIENGHKITTATGVCVWQGALGRQEAATIVLVHRLWHGEQEVFHSRWGGIGMTCVCHRLSQKQHQLWLTPQGFRCSCSSPVAFSGSDGGCSKDTST